MQDSTSKTAPKNTNSVGLIGINILGGYLVLTGILLAYAIFQIWPTLENNNWISKGQILFGLIDFDLSGEHCLILIVILSSLLGSYVHVTTSFVSFVGNGKFTKSWIWWYILRVFVGMSLAIIFYFLIRGGLLTVNSPDGNLSPFGVAAISGLVGLSSKQATDKLRDLFDNLFKTESDKGDTEREGSLHDS